jgi:3-hydroxyacyl-[acyl-carrier-protein] dehydratase
LEIESLYRTIEENSNKIVIKLNTSEHQIFKAHFPNHPILPGFCHIEILSNILKDKITKINLLKLQQKTLPNDTIVYEIDTKENNRKIKILNNDKLIGKLQYEY